MSSPSRKWTGRFSIKPQNWMRQPGARPTTTFHMERPRDRAVVAFAGLAIAWDIGARRAVGFRSYVRGALGDDGRWLPVSFALVPAVVYLASWTGWFASSNGWDRNWAAQNGDHTPVISTLASFIEYQKQMLSFHLGLTTHHPYQ